MINVKTTNVFALILLLAMVGLTAAVQKSEAQWYAGHKTDLEVAGRPAFVITPENPLPGNPWIWRARFPFWHTAMDSILFTKGFHIAYINTDNLYGSPKAVAIWDQFYTYLIDNHHLHYKVTLEGVSRGGLFVYNWAKKNPGKVACIYAEAPVCDIKSWPMGTGKYKGSKIDIERMMSAYDFANRDEAMVYTGNPVDGLEQLAQHKVPVLHLVGLNDQIVPPEENTFILVDRYVRLGGIATIYPNTKGKENLEGHHFEIDDPQYIVDFICRNALEEGPLASSTYHTIRGGLHRAYQKFNKSGKGTVAFLGGSITYNGGWRDSVCQYLEQRFPETEFRFINAGIPSMGSTPGAFRLEKDVLSKGPIDLLFVESAVNDRTNGRNTLEQIRATEGIFRHALSYNPDMDIVFMYFVDPDKMQDYNTGKTPQEILAYELVASHYGIGSLNLAREVTDRINAGEFDWEHDFINLHPSPFGQSVYFRSMHAFMETAWNPAPATEVWSTSNQLPQAIDLHNYSRGRLLDIKNAQLKKGWKLTEKWRPDDKAGTRKGFVDVPMLIGEKPGSKMALPFKGSAVGIVVAAGPDAAMIRYRIDKGPYRYLDLYTRWSAHLHLPWYYVLEAALDPEIPHILEIEMASRTDEASGGNACRIASFFVNAAR
jgi:pimeloyl-ACP methyl ester carboxylesterase